MEKSWVRIRIVSLLTVAHVRRLSHIVGGLTHGTLIHHIRQTHESRAAAAAIVSYWQVTRTHQSECTHRCRATGLTFRYAASHHLSRTSTEVRASTNFAYTTDVRRASPVRKTHSPRACVQRASYVSKFAGRMQLKMCMLNSSLRHLRPSQPRVAPALSTRFCGVFSFCFVFFFTHRWPVVARTAGCKRGFCSPRPYKSNFYWSFSGLLLLR